MLFFFIFMIFYLSHGPAPLIPLCCGPWIYSVNTFLLTLDYGLDSVHVPGYKQVDSVFNLFFVFSDNFLIVLV